MASFPGYAIGGLVPNNRFQIDNNITITLTLNFRQQVDWLYNRIQNAQQFLPEKKLYFLYRYLVCFDENHE